MRGSSRTRYERGQIVAGDAVEPLAPTPTLRQQVHQRLEDLILRGSLRPGEHLVETDLAKRLGVSRGPVREALYLLERDGWVDLRPRYGAFVRETTLEEVEDFFHVRRINEIDAVRLAADRITPAAADDLQVLVNEVLELADGDQVGEDFLRMNARLHHTLSKAGGNRALNELLETLWKRTKWYFAPVVPANRGLDAWREHAAMAEAIIAKDADRAAEVMASHINATEEAYFEHRRAYLELEG